MIRVNPKRKIEREERPTEDTTERHWSVIDYIDAQFTGAMPNALSRRLQTKRTQKGETI